jgi:hypothetical protein
MLCKTHSLGKQHPKMGCNCRVLVQQPWGALAKLAAYSPFFTFITTYRALAFFAKTWSQPSRKVGSVPVVDHASPRWRWSWDNQREQTCAPSSKAQNKEGWRWVKRSTAVRAKPFSKQSGLFIPTSLWRERNLPFPEWWQ